MNERARVRRIPLNLPTSCRYQRTTTTSGTPPRSLVRRHTVGLRTSLRWSCATELTVSLRPSEKNSKSLIGGRSFDGFRSPHETAPVGLLRLVPGRLHLGAGQSRVESFGGVGLEALIPYPAAAKQRGGRGFVPDPTESREAKQWNRNNRKQSILSCWSTQVLAHHVEGKRYL